MQHCNVQRNGCHRKVLPRTFFLLRAVSRRADHVSIYKLKPDIYDGSVPCASFSQFSFIANSNGWCDAARIVALASCLREKARFSTRILRRWRTQSLELCFGEGHSAQSSYLRFTSQGGVVSAPPIMSFARRCTITSWSTIKKRNIIVLTITINEDIDPSFRAERTCYHSLLFLRCILSCMH